MKPTKEADPKKAFKNRRTQLYGELRERMGVGLAQGESLRDSCELALMTALEQVSQIGIAPMMNAALPAQSMSAYINKQGSKFFSIQGNKSSCNRIQYQVVASDRIFSANLSEHVSSYQSDTRPMRPGKEQG